MPGIVGVMGYGPASGRLTNVASILGALSREPDYVTTEILASGDAAMSVFAAPHTGCFRYNSAHAAVAVVGEVFHGAASAGRQLAEQLGSLESPTDVARVLANYDGSYSGAVWWPALKAGAVFVDHSASRPVYYATTGEELYFAPEPKAIRAAERFQTSLDQRSVGAYLTVGHVLRDRTFYAEVRALGPGTVLIAGPDGVQKQQHFRYSLIGDASYSGNGEAHYQERLHDALQLAIARRREELPHSVIPISGGWDSRAILAYARKIYDGPLKTVSWGTTEEDAGADAAIGRQLAVHFRTEHQFLQRRPETLPGRIAEMVERVDGMTTDPAFHYQEVEFMRRIRDEIGVRYLLRGDEVFGYMAPVSSEPEALARIGVRRMSDYPDVLALLRPDAAQTMPPMVDELIEDISQSSDLRDYTARKDYHYFHERLINYLHKATYYKFTVLEVANPWIDRHILDLNATVPILYRHDKDLFKKVVQSKFPELTVPMAARHSLENWRQRLIETPGIRSFVQDHLSQTANPIYQFVDSRKVLSLADALFAGREQHVAQVRVTDTLKQLLRNLSPSLYDKVRRSAVGKIRAASVSPVDLIFRTLILKLWFDRFAPTR